MPLSTIIFLAQLIIINKNNAAQGIRASTFLRENVGLSPFLVNKANDLVCFIFSNITEELNANLDFHYHVPAALKIHQDLYQTVEQLSLRANRPLGTPTDPESGKSIDLIITAYKGDLSSFSSLYTISQLLQRYQLSVFSSFFWTSPSTSDFFSMTKDPVTLLDNNNDLPEAMTSTNSDVSRFQTWGSLSSILEQTAQTSDLSVDDPCSFGKVGINQKSGRITLPVSHLLNHSNPRFGGACLAFAIASFAQGSSFHMSLSNRPELLNYRSRSIEQSSSPGTASQNNPYSANGLLGTGQVVGIADTGVDSKSCYFYDSNGNVAPVDSATSPAPFDTTKRKIIQYTYVTGAGDGTDTPGGHGTHTAGTVAGNNYQSSDLTQGGLYDGVAPGAKLAVMDMSTSGGGVGVPGTASGLITPGYTAGARVFTNSWGSFWPLGTHGTYQTSDMDGFLYQHKVRGRNKLT